MKTDRSSLKKLRILYVEDEHTLAEMMQRAVGHHFGDFRIAENGQEGLQLFKKLRPDLVITDITMPGMDGLTMGRFIHELSADTPLIVLSAYSDKEKLLGAIDTGVSKYFIKPFDPVELLEYLESIAPKIIEKQRIAIRPGYLYDRHSGSLRHQGAPIPLSARERTFLEALLEEPGYFLDTPAIKKLLWPEAEVTDDAVRVFINRLRAKTGKEFLHTRPGEGYYLKVE
ncbi:response regulator transcription factor [Nitratifractor salsuginis]|uniref:Two component transcriptional regulator, winged helix family n=1 Tax=Nitratifractor salsuginis (strain DSM 16511 / JCM 12458 / E9I37-1) TaxID=749222 RepID=E6X088_NITSE|nr:response regulator transcription factor [Nitratifractor salsuginis]ADV45677.1 two component transcriptional regulator, winged helix family [Nitratifractor salsuginis DSM 16511]